MMKVLLVGFGAIGQTIRDAVADDALVQIAAILVKPERRAALQQESGNGIRIICSADELDIPIDCALECAGHSGVAEHVPALLRRGIPAIVTSVGSLADSALVSAS